MYVKDAPEYRAVINNASGPVFYPTDAARQAGLAAADQARKDRGY